MEGIVQRASWQKAAVCTVLFACMFGLVNFSPLGVAGLLQITGGPSILDFAFGYREPKAFIMLTQLGEAGRAFYRTRILPLDFPFPFTYMLCYASWLALLVKHTQPQGGGRWLLWLPVAACGFDWLENIGILFLLRGYPRLNGWAVTLASCAGMAKYICIFASLACIAGLCAALVYRRARRGRAAG